jgi:hypothetical protein
MRRLLLATLCIPLLLFLLAPLLAAAPPLSLDSLAAEQRRLKNAICAKADADNDDYRPYVCKPRCGCLTKAFIRNASRCEATGPDTFTIESVVAPGQCQAGGGTCIVGSSGLACLGENQTCLVAGETCVRSCQFGICFNQCRRPCASDLDCPATTAIAILSGVTQPDSPDVVLCDAGDGAGARKINSNDALACLARIEAVTGPCE